MSPRPPSPFVIDPFEAVLARFEGISRHRIDGTGREGAIDLTMAVPNSFARRKRRRYPVVVLLDAVDMLGSAIEITRALGNTRETGECVLIAANPEPGGGFDPWLDRVLSWCRSMPRFQQDRIALFGRGGTGAAVLRAVLDGRHGIGACMIGAVPAELASGLDLNALARARPRTIAWTEASRPHMASGPVAWHILPECATAALGLPILTHGLRTLWGTGHAYGSELVPMSHPIAEAALRTVSPLLRRLWPRPQADTPAPGPRVIRSAAMGRDFEVFVSLPASAAGSAPRRYPALFALDANGAFSMAAETAAGLAQAGVIEEVIVVGLGTPRSEGDLEFGFRRFEEFSPPPGDHAPDDGLGRFFRSIFALRGQDARKQMGKAPQLHRFLVEELLPRLLLELPIDENALGLAGHSAGGTFVGFAIAQPSSPFRAFAATSPGTAVSGHWMMKPQDAANLPGAGSLIYLSLGSEENENAFNRLAGIPAAPEYAAQLRARCAARVEFYCLQGDTHTTVLPRALAHALTRMFPAKQASGRVPGPRHAASPA